jgi:RNA polymerase sigma factor (sigma-70 family)
MTAVETEQNERGELDRATLDGFRRGEEDAVRAVYARYAGPVYAVARGILREDDLAAEAVQETFVRAWRAAATYDANRRLAPWLYMIARRVAIDLYRSHRKMFAGPPDDDAVVVLPPELDTVWEAYQVRAAVERLPADERTIVRLQHFEQLSHHEIAGRLGIPIGTVKSRSFRAHRRLAEWLRSICGFEGTTERPLAYRQSRLGSASR